MVTRVLGLGRSTGALAAVLLLGSATACAPCPPTPSDSQRGQVYPWHTEIVATTFWVGEVFDDTVQDGSQMYSAYDGDWYASYGGCDGIIVDGTCETERRSAATDYFPTQMQPKENPFYLDLPYDDVNNSAAAERRHQVVPWASEPRYAIAEHNPTFSLMKNRWVQLNHDGRTCYGQIQDAGPGEYDDERYVFGSDDARPKNQRYGGAGMDVSPALNSCLGFAALNGVEDGVSWRFVDEQDVPHGPWSVLITTSR